MSLLVDSRGNPLVADVIGPMYGPTRFEDQPKWVRKRGRKGKALRRTRRTSARRGTRRARRSSYRTSSRRSSGARRISCKRNRADYRKFLGARAGTFGPVRFEDQPTWVRRRGRKSKNRGRSANRRRWTSAARSSTRRSRKASRRASGSRALTRKQKRALNRAAFRKQTSRRGVRKSARRGTRKASRRGSSRRSSSASASRRISYGSIMKQLRGSKNKAWVCAGPTRTGCGGGRKGRRGSRVIGILRG